MGVGLTPSAPVEEKAVGGVLFLLDEDLPAAVYLPRPAFTGGKDDGRDGLSELVLVGTAALGAAA